MLQLQRASAGSGKTYTLAKKFILFLISIKEDGKKRRLRTRNEITDGLARILAITFTNKATEEMKSRIVQELHAIAAGEDTEYMKMLSRELGCQPSELSASALVAMQQLLYDFQYFNVSTIDSFFQMVLRTFAREIDKPGNYEVELNDNYAVAVGVGMMLGDLNANDTQRTRQLASWLTGFMLEAMDSGKGFNVFNRNSSLHSAMVRFIGRMCNEDFKQSADTLLQYLEDPSRLQSFIKALSVQIAKADAVCSENSRRAIAMMTSMGLPSEGCVNKTIMAELTLMAQGTRPAKKRFFDAKAPAALTSILSDGVQSPTIYMAAYRKNPARPPASLDAAIVDAITSGYNAVVTAGILEAVRSNLFHLGLIGHAMTYVEQFRKDNNIILLSDTNDLLRQIISDSDTPFIYERIGLQLKNYLIDEFQDTSRMQWHNLRPLVANSLSTGNDSLIIGDEKQSIYRFRNADSSLLHSAVASQFPTSHRIRGNNIAENTNYRSRDGIVRFNNTLFRRLAEILDSEYYSNATQAISTKYDGKGGYIQLRGIDAPNMDAYHSQAFPLMAGDILRQIESGYRPGEIAILVRTRQQGEAVVNYLLKEHPGIHVMSDESLLLSSCRSVRMIVSLLRLIESSRTSERLHSNSKFASAKEIMMILNRFEFHLSNGMDASEAVDRAIGGRGDLAALIGEINAQRPSTIMSLVEYIVYKVLPEASRDADNAYLVAFQDNVTEYCAHNSGDLHSFIRWWDAMKDKLSVPAGDAQDSIRVLTIHKSKGLQYQCVHIPFLSWPMSKTGEAWYSGITFPGIDPAITPPIFLAKGDNLLANPLSPMREQFRKMVKDEESDNLNLIYVAFTRAVSELSIYYNTSKSGLVGNLVAEAAMSASMPGNGKEFYTDICGMYDPVSMSMTIGIPTAPIRPTNGSSGNPGQALAAPRYISTFRDDTQQFTQIPDDSQPPYLEDGEDSGASPDTGIAEEERRRGLVLHYVLSKVMTPDDLDDAFRKVARASRLDKDKRLEYLEILHNALSTDSPYVKSWFNGYTRILNERPIYHPERQATYRPDRIVWTAGGNIDIVDYKFTNASHDSHMLQVRRYMRLLESMGYSNVRGFLWYPISGDIIRVTL